MQNYMEIEFLSIPQNESFSRSVISAFCLIANPTIDELNDVKTAVSEAVTNCIVHGYNSKNEGIIKIKASIDENILNVKVVDYGVGIPNVKMALEPFFTTKPNEERSGMGFTIMGTFMDSVNVTSDKETVVEMTKRFSGRENAKS